MGDPKKQRKKFNKPTHPWQRTRLEEEKVLKSEYALKNKKELWKMNSLLSKFKAQTKVLIRKSGEQGEKEVKQFLDKLTKLNLIPANTPIEDVLNLTLKDILERRLQTIVFRKGLAKTMKQARQFITHGHVIVNNKKITIPSYIVPLNEEGTLEFAERSPLSDVEHPERKLPETIVEKIEEIKPVKETKEGKIVPAEEETPKEEVKEEAKEWKQTKS